MNETMCEFSTVTNSYFRLRLQTIMHQLHIYITYIKSNIHNYYMKKFNEKKINKNRYFVKWNSECFDFKHWFRLQKKQLKTNGRSSLLAIETISAIWCVLSIAIAHVCIFAEDHVQDKSVDWKWNIISNLTEINTITRRWTHSCRFRTRNDNADVNFNVFHRAALTECIWILQVNAFAAAGIDILQVDRLW